MESFKRFIVFFGSIVIIAICIVAYYWNKDDERIDNHHVIDEKSILDDLPQIKTNITELCNGYAGLACL